MENKYIFNKIITGSQIKLFRDVNGLSLRDFSSFINTSPRTVERWEYENTQIKGPIVTLVRLLQEYPEMIEKYRVENKKYPLRMYYMYKEDISTIIDVDVIKQKVCFKNYTNDLSKRAFGVFEEVTFKQYEEFLENRCWPRDRDKQKIILEQYGLPFYDPYLIIRKTQGRMLDDDCWIKLEDRK